MVIPYKAPHGYRIEGHTLYPVDWYRARRTGGVTIKPQLNGYFLYPTKHGQIEGRESTIEQAIKTAVKYLQQLNKHKDGNYKERTN